MRKSPFFLIALGAWLFAQGGCMVVHDTDCETDDDCDPGRACNSGQCVGAETSSNPSGGSGSGGSSSQPKAGSASTTGGGSTETCTSSSPSTCSGTTSIRTCVEGSYDVLTCSEYLGAIGFASNACAANKCTVTGVLDEQCSKGAGVVCACGEGCTDEENINLYISCYLDDPAGNKAKLRCLAGYVSGGEVNCAAAEACLSGA